jgi:hypothetical protein
VPLKGIVEIGETWVGGYKRARNRDEMGSDSTIGITPSCFRDTRLRMIEGETLPYAERVAEQ